MPVPMPKFMPVPMFMPESKITYHYAFLRNWFNRTGT